MTPQLWAMALLVLALVAGGVRLALGQASPLGTVFNMVWVVFDLVVFSVVIRAVRYQGFSPDAAPDAADAPRLETTPRTSDEGAA